MPKGAFIGNGKYGVDDVGVIPGVPDGGVNALHCREMVQQRFHWLGRGVGFTHSARPYISSAPTREDKVGCSS